MERPMVKLGNNRRRCIGQADASVDPYQLVSQRIEPAEVAPYDSPSSAMFDSEHLTYSSQFQSHQLNSEFHHVQRQRSQSSVSRFPSSEPTDTSSYHYQSHHPAYELKDASRQRSQSYVLNHVVVSESCQPSNESLYHLSMVPAQYSNYPLHCQSSELLEVSRQGCVSPYPRQTSSDIYSFTFTDVSNDPDDLEQATQGVQDLSMDYHLPTKIPESSQDSGCISSEESNSTEATELKDNLLISSPLPDSSPEFCASQSVDRRTLDVDSTYREVTPDPVISGRVSRRNVSRIQGSRSSLPNSERPTQSVYVPRKSPLLPTPQPQYVSRYMSDDSGADVSTDDETYNGCQNGSRNFDSCTGCEDESRRLILAESSRQYRLLPDYMKINFMLCQSNPGFIDSHCHLDFLFQRLPFEGSYSDYRLQNSETYPVSYEGCVAVFCNPNTFYRKTMWQKFLNEEGVWGTFGCHPHNANLYNDLIEKDLCRALQHSKVRALGEIGLDYSNRNDCSKEKQHLVLRRQLKIALTEKLPLVIHCRDANEDLMTIMKEMLPKNHLIHLHCFTDDWDWAQKWMSEFPNLFIGITNLVTYHSAEPTHDVAKRIPLDRLLLETDAPYFVPRRIPRTTRHSHPGMAIHVAAQIATLRNIPLKDIIHHTRENTQKMYRL